MRTDQDHALSFEGDQRRGGAGARAARRVRHGGAGVGGVRAVRGERDGDERRAAAAAPGLGRPVRPLDERAEPEGERAAVDRVRLPRGRRRPAGGGGAERGHGDRRRPPDCSCDTSRGGRSTSSRPIGFTRGLVLEHGGKHPGTVDLKHGGIVIIGNIARAHAIRSGVTAKRTLERLRAAEGLGAIDAETREGLEESFRFLWEVRLRHHVERWRAGEDPTTSSTPTSSGPWRATA